MTRYQYRQIIQSAHEYLHDGNPDAAHDALHDALLESESMTTDPEVQSAVAAFVLAADGQMPCGHTYGDLIWAPGAVTKCGACLTDRKKSEQRG